MHLRYIRHTVLEILREEQLASDAKLHAIEQLFKAERDENEEAEDPRA